MTDSLWVRFTRVLDRDSVGTDRILTVVFTFCSKFSFAATLARGIKNIR